MGYLEKAWASRPQFLAPGFKGNKTRIFCLPSPGAWICKWNLSSVLPAWLYSRYPVSFTSKNKTTPRQTGRWDSQGNMSQNPRLPQELPKRAYTLPWVLAGRVDQPPQQTRPPCVIHSRTTLISFIP